MTSARDEERKKSLAALRRIAEESQRMPWLPKPPAKKPAPRRDASATLRSAAASRSSPAGSGRDVRMAPVDAPAARRPAPTAPAAAPRARPPALDPRYEGKAAKQEEERRLRALRAQKLQQGATASWRGMDRMGVPASIRRTAFDREEPSVAQKISDVLGEAKEKEGRAKARDKGRRQGTR